MNTPDSSDNKRVLYLDQIAIETDQRMRFNFKLQKDDNDVEIEQTGGRLSWIPSRSLEIVGVSKIAIQARSRYLPLGRFAMLTEVNGEEAMDSFWDSNESVSRSIMFDRQLATIRFHFRPSHTSDTIRTAIKNIQTAMKDYKGMMTESTQQRIDTAIRFGAALAEARLLLLLSSMSHNPQMNLFAKLGFGLAKVTFDLLKEQRKYDENVSDLASGIDRLLPFAERAFDVVLYEEELFDGVVRKLYDLIGDTAHFVVGYAKRGPAMRALKSTISQEDHNKIEALQGSFIKLREDFDRAVEVAVLTVVKRTEETSLLKRLKLVEAASYQEKHSCMEGTRTIVLDHIIGWATKPFDRETKSNSSNVFWLYGMPGLGKTSVANSLCDRLRKSGNLGGSFICKYDNPSLREPEAVLSTLIAMLVRVWGPFRQLVAKVLLDEPLINPQSTPGELLLKPLKLLKKHPPRPLVLVIDALDECGKHNTRGPLLSCLVEACSLVHWLKVVVTSRPERDIQSFFDARNVTSVDLAADDLSHKDIRLFTTHCMGSIAIQRHLPSEWPGEECVNKIVERSNGLFIFVETLYRLVDVPEPEQLLAQVLGGDSQGAETTLHHLYSMAITSRISQPTPAFHSILRAIVAISANRPLCDEALAELISLEARVVRSWVDELSSLLYRDHSNKGGIRVRHLSILEFLVGSTCPPDFRVDLNLANAEVARCCLETMVNELRFNICELETSYLANAEIRDLNNRVERMIPDILQYSCVHWFNHLCYDFDPVGAAITRRLDNFFSNSQPLYWLEVLSLMGKVPVAILGLRLMKAHFKKFEGRHQRLVEDALRLVLAFFTPISTSATHIYISVLPFMPMESSVWKIASTSFPGILNLGKGRMKDWPAPSIIWQGHTSSVRSVAYSPDGRNVVSGSSDNTIRIWDAQTGAAVGEPLRGHTGTVFSVAYSPDGRTIVSGSEDNTIRIWDAQTGAAVGEPLRGHTSWVSGVAYSPDGRNVVSGSHDNTIRIWDAQIGAAVGEPLTGHTGKVLSVACSPDGRNVVSGSDDQTIRIWDVQTGSAVGQPLTGHTGWVYSVAYSPDGQNVVSGFFGFSIRTWDTQTGAVGEPLKGHTDFVKSIAYSPDGRNIVSGSDDKTIRIWDAQTGAAVGAPLKGHTSRVSSVTYSPDGRNVVSSSDDKTIRIWDAQTGAAVGEPVTGHTSWVYSVVYSSDRRIVVSGSSDNTIRIWDAQTGAAVGEPLTGHTGKVLSVTRSPDGRNVVSGSSDKTIRIWDMKTGAAVGEPLTGHTSWVYSVAYSPNGRNVVSGSGDNTIRIWDAQTGAAVRKPLKGHTGTVLSVAYSPHGRNIVTGSRDHTIRIWDTQTGSAVGEPLTGHTGWVYSVAYSPDGRNVVSGSFDNTIRIWDAQTGAAVGEPLTGHAGRVWSVTYSPDGRNIVSGSDDNTIRIWDPQAGTTVGEPLTGHTGTVCSVAYSPDGRNIVSGSSDNTIRIWDALASTQAGVHDIPSDSGNLSNHLHLQALSGRPIPTGLLSSNGWVCCPDGLLFWVPEDCRNGLTSPAITTIPNTGRQKCVRIDFSHFQCGSSWTDVHERNSGGQS